MKKKKRKNKNKKRKEGKKERKPHVIDHYVLLTTFVLNE